MMLIQKLTPSFCFKIINAKERRKSIRLIQVSEENEFTKQESIAKQLVYSEQTHPLTKNNDFHNGFHSVKQN